MLVALNNVRPARSERQILEVGSVIGGPSRRTGAGGSPWCGWRGRRVEIRATAELAFAAWTVIGEQHVVSDNVQARLRLVVAVEIGRRFETAEDDDAGSLGQPTAA